LRARNPCPYGLEEVVVFAPMSEISRRQRGTTISSRLSSVAGLAGLRIQISTRCNCSWITGERVLYRIRALRDHYPRTQTYRRNPKINTSSPDRMQPATPFKDHLLWSSLLVLVPRISCRTWWRCRTSCAFLYGKAHTRPCPVQRSRKSGSGLFSKRKDRAWSTLRPLLMFQQSLGIQPLEKKQSPA